MKRLPALLLSAALAGGLPEGPVRAQAASLSGPTQADWLARVQDMERRGDWRGLLESGLAWTQAESDNPLAWFVLGRAYRGLGRYPEAVVAYQQTLRLDPADVRARTNLGNAYRDSRRLRDALLAYREAVRVNPAYFPAWKSFGQTFYLLKGELGVVDAVQRVRQVNPQLAAAWYSLMVGYYRSRDDAAAQEALELLRRLRPEEVDRLFAIVLEQAG